MDSGARDSSPIDDLVALPGKPPRRNKMVYDGLSWFIAMWSNEKL
jgi:hypothetical protein